MAERRSYRRGDEVSAFFRCHQLGSEPWFPVPSPGCGSCTPRIGFTDGWMPATVLSDFDPSRYDGRTAASQRETGVHVKFSAKLWYSRAGERLDPKRDSRGGGTDRLPPEQVMLADRPPPSPLLSLVVFRWGGDRPCDPVHGGGGGWGRTGSMVSDPYIRYMFEEVIYPTVGCQYECMSVFVGGSADLDRIHPGSLCGALRGKFKAAFYFLWPVHFQDSVENPGYVAQDKLLGVMSSMEECGITTRFPHHSNMYRLLLSKDWMSHLCLDPSLQAPVTTKVPRALILSDPRAAARRAAETITQLRRARGLPDRPAKGVAKLGFSWEAMDVRKFQGEDELADSLDALCAQRLGLRTPSVMVQDWCDITLELRLFFIDARPQWDAEHGRPKLVKPAHTLYTVFTKTTHNGCFTDFERLPREVALQRIMRGDDAALRAAEQKCIDLGSRALFWLQTECAEAPPVIRLDFMVTHSARGEAEVALGELTELGGCFLGWKEGPYHVWGACLRSCFQAADDECRMPQSMLAAQPCVTGRFLQGPGKGGRKGHGRGSRSR